MRPSIKSSFAMTSVSLVLLFALVGHQVIATAELAASLGLASELGHLSNSISPSPLKDVGNILSTVPKVLNAVTKPMTGIVGNLANGDIGTASLGGLVTGLSAATGLGAARPRVPSSILGAESLASHLGATSSVGAAALAARGAGMRNAMVDAAAGAASAAEAGGSYLRGSSALGSGLNALAAANAYHREAAASAASEQVAYSALDGAVPEVARGPVAWNSGVAGARAAATAVELAAANGAADLSVAANGLGAANAALGAGAAGASLALSAAAARVPGIGAIPALPATPAEHVINGIIPASQILSRQALATDALNNAQAESAIAGADMVAHGANNARSASLASNAYRQAKLASARDRVNIAGTIQNSARISDAAIATHDAATKAEDSLLGSELAVDSAATVLDSDAAYIPPVTSSMLRSLPYGRLGLRNIVPKPLTYPSVLLPDVWLNGVPVNYLNVPFRQLPYGIGLAAYPSQLQASGVALAGGQIINGQPFFSNNGMLINGMVVDPTWAYLTNNIAGIAGSSIIPILANGQLEALDEVAVANAVTLQQQTGAGQAATYQGFGRLNPVPMLTGSISDVNLAPTTTIGTTYPIGSALVIEPRDSYFQDYVDNASSRQNFDEHQQ